MNVKITIGESIIKITYQSPVELSQLLEFEGKRLSSLIDRNIKLPEYDVRYWDTQREITVRKQTGDNV